MWTVELSLRVSSQLAYFESLTCSLFTGVYGFHGCYNRLLIGKQVDFIEYHLKHSKCENEFCVCQASVAVTGGANMGKSAGDRKSCKILRCTL